MNAILKTLNDIMIHGVEIQLKILQTILPLLTNYHTIHGDVLAEVSRSKDHILAKYVEDYGLIYICFRHC